MPGNTGKSTVASHTEYVRTRVRCPGCGEHVSADGGRPKGGLCANCRKTVGE